MVSEETTKLTTKEILAEPSLQDLLNLCADRAEDAWRGFRYGNYKYAQEMIDAIPEWIRDAAFVHENNRRFRR